MHANVFQIWNKRVGKKNRLDEYTLECGEGCQIGCCHNLDENERQERINELMNDILPQGMFTYLGNDVLRYNGGIKEWKQQWVNDIKFGANRIDEHNVALEIGPAEDLLKVVENPLNTDSLFYLNGECYNNYAEKSAALMRAVCPLKEGTLLYLGGIIDYQI